MLIRDALIAEVGRIEALHRRAAAVGEDDAAALAAHPDAIETPTLAVREGRVRVAVDDAGTIVGFCVAQVQAGGAWELVDLFVEPASMGRGVGRSLVDDLARRARAAGMERIEVTANPHAVGFYERSGFQDTGTLVPTRFRPAPRMALDLRS
jgi:ribosomal protein S18 acetylase RimI-like enzyme